MVPPFVRTSGLLPELAALSESVDDYHNNVHKNVQLAEAYADEIRRQAAELGIVKDLGRGAGDRGSRFEHDTLHAIEDYLIELRGQNIPYGLHAFGRTPGAGDAREHRGRDRVRSTGSLLPNDADGAGGRHGAADRRNRVRASSTTCCTRSPAVTSRRANGGEPIRNPDAYPTGKNFYGIDPDKVPKPAAWRLGVFLAERLLKDHVAEHGQPSREGLVRHLGRPRRCATRGCWNRRSSTFSARVRSGTPAARWSTSRWFRARELGRPRVDIVIASAAEGMFNNVTRLMERGRAAGEGSSRRPRTSSAATISRRRPR